MSLLVLVLCRACFRRRQSVLDAWLRGNLTVLDVRFERQQVNGWKDVCGELPTSWERAIFGSHRAMLPPEYRLRPQRM